MSDVVVASATLLERGPIPPIATPPPATAPIHTDGVVRARSIVADYVSLAKPRISVFAALSAVAGHALGASSPAPRIQLGLFAGVLCAAGGASAANMVWERALDRLMVRTRGRPLAAGRIRPGPAATWAGALVVLGVTLVAAVGGPLAAGLTLASFVGYLLVYTPLKTRTSLNTLVGAIPGALPPLIGWVAARGDPWGGGLWLFALLFLWQVPHFLAIAWLHRADYARAGMPMLPVLDAAGRLTGRQMLVYGAALVGTSAMVWNSGLAGDAYLTGALALGAIQLAPCLAFAIHPGTTAARGVFIASLVYLPAVFLLLVADKVPR